VGQLFESSPAAGDEAALLADVRRRLAGAVETGFNRDGLKIGMAMMKLGERGIAAGMWRFAGGCERLGIDLPIEVP